MPKLTDEQIQEAKEAFRMFDKNGDGHITQDELINVLQACGQNPTRAQVNEMVARMDDNSNGKIEFSEFIDMLSENFESKDKIQNDLREAFKVFDRDGNGFITASELRYTMTNLGEKMTDKEVDQMIDEADRNGDGRVDYNEFIEMIVQNRK